MLYSHTWQESQPGTLGDLEQNSPGSAHLHRYLVIAAHTPWEWGDADCSTFVADWVKQNGYSDPMCFWRGEYSTEEGANALKLECGGLQYMFMLGLFNSGIDTCHKPRMGDVGIVEVQGEHGLEEVGAIFGGKRWHMRSPNGLFAASVKPILSWRIERQV